MDARFTRRFSHKATYQFQYSHLLNTTGIYMFSGFDVKTLLSRIQLRLIFTVVKCYYRLRLWAGYFIIQNWTCVLLMDVLLFNLRHKDVFFFWLHENWLFWPNNFILFLCLFHIFKLRILVDRPKTLNRWGDI